MSETQIVSDLARLGLEIAQDYLPPEQKDVTFINARTQRKAYVPGNKPVATEPIEYFLTLGTLTRRKFTEAIGGVVTASIDQVYTHHAEDLPSPLRDMVKTRIGVNQLIQENSTWAVRLEDGSDMKVKEVSLTGPVVSFRLRGIG